MTVTNTETSLSYTDNVVPYRRPVRIITPEQEQEALNTFLTDNQIGPLTGLSKIFADFDLYEELYKIEDPLIQKKGFYGVLASYYERDKKNTPHPLRISRGYSSHEREMIEQIVVDERNPLTGDAIADLEKAIHSDDYGQHHRFAVLTHDYAEMQKMEYELEQRLAEANEVMSKPLHNISTVRALQREQDTAALRYSLQKQLLGINLAQADLDKVEAYAQDLRHFPNREKYEKTFHTATVLNYLDNGGLETLRSRITLQKSPRYWWAYHIGNGDHPGVWRRGLRPFAEDLKTNVPTTLFYMSLFGGSMWAIQRLAPQVTALLEQVGLR